MFGIRCGHYGKRRVPMMFQNMILPVIMMVLTSPMSANTETRNDKIQSNAHIQSIGDSKDQYHHHLRHQHGSGSIEEYVSEENEYQADESGEPIAVPPVVEPQQSDETQPQHMFAAYHESYITKEAANMLRQRMQLNRANHVNDQSINYDDLLQEINFKRPKPDIFDKKYFDYFPEDENNSAALDADENVSSHSVDVPMMEMEFQQLGEENDQIDDGVVTHQDDHHAVKTHGGRKKRGVVWADNQAFINNERRPLAWSNQDQQQQQSRQLPSSMPSTFYIPNEKLRPINRYIAGNDISNNDLNPNHPWNNRLYGPSNLNNRYLPVAPPPRTGYHYPRPIVPFDMGSPGVHHNVGYPPHNPGTPDGEKQTPVSTVDDRFGENDDLYLGRPVWGVSDSNARPPLAAGNEINTQTNRPHVSGPPRSTSRPITPPLIHNSDDDGPEIARQRPQSSQGSVRPGNTRRPTPSLIHNSDDDDPAESLHSPPRQQPSNALGNDRQGGGFADARAVAPPVWSTGPIFNTPPLRRRPQRPLQQQFVPEAAPTGPSRCVWGIVSCCTGNSLIVRYECFERLGCNGAFWDLNPCSDLVLNAAIDEADRFFD